jgi:hypothetical protein
MPLCAPCQALVDDDPIGVLLRRDEFGNNVLCGKCRHIIYSVNSAAAAGLIGFTYENPNQQEDGVAMHLKRELLRNEQTPLRVVLFSPPTASAYQNEWFCKQCRCRVWASPRAFDGDNEPEDWWWCISCKKEKQEMQKERRNAEKVERERRRKEAKLDHDKKSRIILETQKYPKLDKWLLG